MDLKEIIFEEMLGEVWRNDKKSRSTHEKSDYKLASEDWRKEQNDYIDH
jgi:hypothetical protein